MLTWKGTQVTFVYGVATRYSEVSMAAWDEILANLERNEKLLGKNEKLLQKQAKRREEQAKRQEEQDKRQERNDELIDRLDASKIMIKPKQ